MNPNAQFDRDLQQWLQAEAPATAPAGFHASVIGRARAMHQRPGWITSLPVRRLRGGRGMAVLAAAAVLGGGALAAASGVVRLPTVVLPQPSPSLGPVPSSSGSTAPSASPVPVAGPGGAWIPVGSMVMPRSDFEAVQLLDGRVLVVGGSGGEFGDMTAELYDPVTGTWSATGRMLKPHAGFAPVVLLDGRVLIGDVVDGTNGPDVYGSELYDPATGKWSATGAQIGTGGGSAVVLSDGRVFATVTVADMPGGAVYDADTGKWTATAARNTRNVVGGSTILLADGRVLVAGGYDFTLGGDPSFAFTDAAEVYDPATGSWAEIAAMSDPSKADMGRLLPDGRALVVGRYGSWEIYDPATGRWTALARPTWDGFPKAVLSDGTVLMIGSSPNCAAAALYDPRTGSVAAVSIMPRCGDSSFTSLLDGTVLVAGGMDCNADRICVSNPSAMVYVPAGLPLPNLSAFPGPVAPSFPSPTPVPTALSPAVGPVPPNARSWTVTVDNRSSKPAALFVANDKLELVGSATPNVVPAGETVEVTFLFPVDGGWIFVNPRPGDSGVVDDHDIGIPGKIVIGLLGGDGAGWLSP